MISCFSFACLFFRSFLPSHLKYWTDFFQKWGYQDEQKKDIARAMTILLPRQEEWKRFFLSLETWVSSNVSGWPCWLLWFPFLDLDEIPTLRNTLWKTFPYQFPCRYRVTSDCIQVHEQKFSIICWEGAPVIWIFSLDQYYVSIIDGKILYHHHNSRCGKNQNSIARNLGHLMYNLLSCWK